MFQNLNVDVQFNCLPNLAMISPKYAPSILQSRDGYGETPKAANSRVMNLIGGWRQR